MQVDNKEFVNDEINHPQVVSEEYDIDDNVEVAIDFLQHINNRRLYIYTAVDKLRTFVEKYNATGCCLCD